MDSDFNGNLNDRIYKFSDIEKEIYKRFQKRKPKIKNAQQMISVSTNKLQKEIDETIWQLLDMSYEYNKEFAQHLRLQGENLTEHDVKVNTVSALFISLFYHAGKKFGADAVNDAVNKFILKVQTLDLVKLMMDELSD